MDHDDLGNRMKGYESASDVRLDLAVPIVARVDGRGFSSFTRDMVRPFDATFSDCMETTCRALTEDTGACIGYTQSDEMTFAWLAKPGADVWFGGRLAKMTSQLAAQATLLFYRQVLERMPQWAPRHPSFDARVWNVPSRAEGASSVLWRELDAVKNSVSMLALAHFSHRDLLGRSTAQKLEMLRAKGVEWEELPERWKRGAYIQRRMFTKPFSAEEIERLPPRHHARTNPGLVVKGTEYARLQIPPLLEIANREEVIFDGAAPTVRAA